MSKISTLKSILQKEDSQQGFNKFSQILKTQALHFDSINLLLRWAVQNQKKQFAKYYKLLCEYGANVNFVDTRERKSNLMIACEKKNQEIVQILVNDQRLDFLLEDSTNKTVLFYAITNKIRTLGEKYVRILLKKCPQLITKNNRKYSALLESINLNKVQIVKVLLQEGFDPNQITDNNNNTHLHQAIRLFRASKQKPQQRFTLPIVTLLLEKGADPYKVNAQGKNCFQIADKYSQQIQQIYTNIKNKKQGEKKQEQIKVKPILCINDPNQREEMFTNAGEIYKKYKYLIDPLIKKKSLQISPINEQQESDGFPDDPFEPSINIINKLSLEIQNLTNQCIIDHHNARKQLEQFIKFLTPISGELGFSIQIYGSYATGLWINQCDIDILLIPMRQIYNMTLWQILQTINQKLKGTIYQRATIVSNIKIPLMRILISEDKDIRKNRRIDLSIFSPNNSGRQHVEYVNQFIRIFPQIKPLFYVIKKLTNCYKMNDPMKFGVRSFALFLMLVIFMQEPHSDNLGDLLLRFLYKYGYICEYKYDENIGKMILNLPDPINSKNDMGKNTDAYILQRMFKASYMMLHTRDIQNKLEYMFESREMFL